MKHLAHLGVDHANSTEAALHSTSTTILFILGAAVLIGSVIFLARRIKMQEVKIPIKKKEQ